MFESLPDLPLIIKLTKQKIVGLVYGSVVNWESIEVNIERSVANDKGASKEEAGIQIYSRSVFGRRWE